MNKYEIILYWSDTENTFIAEVPELRGCAAKGASYAEALQKAETAMGEWLETAKRMRRDIPLPKGKLPFA